MTSDNVRKMIRKFVSQRPRNTAEIANWLEKKSEFANMQTDISGVLESDSSIVRIGTSGREYPLSEWATEEWVAHHERAKPIKEE